MYAFAAAEPFTSRAGFAELLARLREPLARFLELLDARATDFRRLREVVRGAVELNPEPMMVR